MSFPYRVVVHISNDQYVQVVMLRLINVAMSVIGLWQYTKLGSELGASKKINYTAALLYSLIPVAVLVAATVSYDNMLFLITPLFLRFGLKIFNNNLSPATILSFVALGLLGSLVKFTFLPVFVVAVLYLMIRILRRDKLSVLRRQIQRVSSLNTREWLLITAVLVCTVLFVARYGVAVARFHSPIPVCSLVLTEQRCMQNPVYNMVKSAEQTKALRTPDPLQEYAQDWVSEMLKGLEVSASPTENGSVEVARSLPVISFLTVIGSYALIIVLLFTWQSIKRPESWDFIIVVTGGLVLSLFAFNAASYYEANTDLNIQTRYILSVVPTLFTMALAGTSQLFGHRKTTKVAILFIFLVIFTQGGGLIKHIVSSRDSWYWPKDIIVTVNHDARGVLKKIVKE